VVGIASGIANQLFDANPEDSNWDNIVSELMSFGTIAQQI
jgi:hypothetical protein